jgi:hypothetical protein
VVVGVDGVDPVVGVDGVVVVVREDVVVVVAVLLSLPTVMVTLEPFLAVELADGFWEITRPFWPGSVTT